jgi:hypothetical protein
LFSPYHRFMKMLKCFFCIKCFFILSMLDKHLCVFINFIKTFYITGIIFFTFANFF